MEILKTINLSKIYGNGENKVVAVNKANISINKGELISIVGESGSGKSTLLNLIGGIDIPTEGEVIVDGRRIYMMKDNERTIFRRKKIGFIFQGYNLIPELTVEENILLPILFDKGKKDVSFMEDLLIKLDLYKRRKHLPNQLSGGQQQRVAIGRALIMRPSIILADEPTGNLDRKNSSEVMKLLQRMAADYNQTIIIVTHNNNIAKQATRIFRVVDGKIEIGGCL